MNKSKALVYLNLTLCIFSVTLIYVLLPYGVNACDEPALIIQTESTEVNPLVPLSYCVSNAIASCFDYQWIAYRAISVTVFALAIIVACVYHYRRVKDINKSLLICWSMMLMYALQKDSWYSIYGYDCYSVLFTTIFAIAALEYIHRPGFRTLILLGVLSGVNMFFRFPNLTGIPLIVALVITRNIMDDNRSLKNGINQLLVYLAAVFVTILIACIVFFGSLSSYADRLAILTNVKGHGSNIVIGYIYHLFINVVPYVSYIVSIYLLYALVDSKKAALGRASYALNACIMVFAVIELAVLWRLLFLSKLIFIVSACMALMLYAAVYNRKGSQVYLSILFLFACGFITTFGSNGGLSKYMVFSMIPLVALYIPRCDLRLRLSAVTVYISLILISCAAIMKGTFADDGLPVLNSEINYPRARGLVTSEAQARTVNQAIHDFSGYATSADVQTTVIGNHRGKYIYDYLFACQNPHVASVWDDADYYNDDTTVRLIEQDILESQKDYYILYLKAGSNTKMQSMLDNTSYRDKETDAYIIYVHHPKR